MWSFIGAIFRFCELAVVPNGPITLTAIVENVEDVATLYICVRLIMRRNDAKRNAVDLTCQPLDFFALLNVGDNFLAVRLIE